MSEQIRIVIADDHTLVRQGIRALLETDPRMRVVAEAADGHEALARLEENRAEVVLMDLRMPRMDGIAALHEILRRDPGQAVIILTTFDEDELMREALMAGARGYLLKDMTRETLLRTVEAAAHGGTLLEPGLLERVLSARPDGPSGGASGGTTGGASGETSTQSGRTLRDSAPQGKPQPGANGSPLTEREREILHAIAAGNTSRSAAEELGITERTVKAHLTSVFDKLGVDTRAAAIACAIERGWL